MTTYINFEPSNTQPFQFSPVLDGTAYSGIVTWNVFGQRYYLNLYTIPGVRILTIPMVSGVNLVAGYFTTSTLVFDSSGNRFIVTP